MNSLGSFNSRKKRQETVLSSRFKQPKTAPKSTVEDLFPFQIPNLQTLAPQTKQYINQLQKQYIQRYNILINNRLIFEQILQNIATELDEKGIDLPNLNELYKSVSPHKNKSDDNNL